MYIIFISFFEGDAMALDVVNKIKQAEQQSADAEISAKKDAEYYIKKSAEEARVKAEQEIKIKEEDRLRQINAAKTKAEEMAKKAKTESESESERLIRESQSRENEAIQKILDIIVN